MKKLIERKEYLDKLLSYKDKDIIKVVTGLRRSGKSTLLELFRNQLLENGVTPEQTQFYNFELPENYLNKSWETLYFEIKSKLQADKPNYIFLMKFRTFPILKSWLMVCLLPPMLMFILQDQMQIYYRASWLLY